MKYLLLPIVLVLLNISGLLAQEIPEVDWEELNKTKPWEKTEVWNPEPVVVTPGAINAMPPPADATVLFDGSDLSQWQKPQFGFEGIDMEQASAIVANLDPGFEHEPAGWKVENGEIVVEPGQGPIETVQEFGNMQLHIEWLSPVDQGKEGQAYSNSGIFLMSLYEVQVLNSYQNRTYGNGQAGSIYKQHMPLVNASRPPGEWQSYDIIFTAPTFNDDGRVASTARISVIHNGVLIQNNTEIQGPTVFIGKPHYVKHPPKMPLRLQDHGDKVRFRNIWVREL